MSTSLRVESSQSTRRRKIEDASIYHLFQIDECLMMRIFFGIGIRDSDVIISVPNDGWGQTIQQILR